MSDTQGRSVGDPLKQQFRAYEKTGPTWTTTHASPNYPAVPIAALGREAAVVTLSCATDKKQSTCVIPKQ